MFDLTAPDVAEHIEEFRRLARAAEDRKRARDGRKDAPRLVNTARMVKLQAICGNPYHLLATDRRSAIDMMEVCAINLTEREDFKAAGKLWSDIARYRHVRMPEMTTVRRLDAHDELPPEHPRPEPTVPVPPGPDLPPAPAGEAAAPVLAPQPLRPQGAYQHFVDNLPDRQRADLILLGEREAANPTGGPTPEQRWLSFKHQLQTDTAISGL